MLTEVFYEQKFAANVGTETRNLIFQNIIEPKYLRKLEDFRRESILILHQLNIYQMELDYLMRKTVEPSRVAMLIKTQPFPSVINQREKRKGKSKVEDSISVVLLKGASSDARVEGEISVSLVFDGQKVSSGPSASIIDSNSVFEGEVAKFDKLCFKKGTGLKLVRK